MVPHPAGYPGGSVLPVWGHPDLGNGHRRRFRRRRGGGGPDTKPMGDTLRHARRSPRCVGLHTRTGFRCVPCLHFMSLVHSMKRVLTQRFSSLSLRPTMTLSDSTVRPVELLLCYPTQLDAAYQSALLTTPLILLRVLASLLQLSPTFRTLLNLLILASVCFMAYVRGVLSKTALTMSY
jgi:hypothetical protein